MKNHCRKRRVGIDPVPKIAGLCVQGHKRLLQDMLHGNDYVMVQQIEFVV